MTDGYITFTDDYGLEYKFPSNTRIEEWILSDGEHKVSKLIREHIQNRRELIRKCINGKCHHSDSGCVDFISEILESLKNLSIFHRGKESNFVNNLSLRPRNLFKYERTPSFGLIYYYPSIISSCFGKKNDIAELLLINGYNPNDYYRQYKYHGRHVYEHSRGDTILMDAVRSFSPKLVSLLLECGADMHIRDRHGQTALEHGQRYLEREIFTQEKLESMVQIISILEEKKRKDCEIIREILFEASPKINEDCVRIIADFVY